MLFGEIAAEFFNLDFLRKLWGIYLKGNENVWRIIYTAYIFVLWVENCYEKPGGTAAGPFRYSCKTRSLNRRLIAGRRQPPGGGSV